MAKTGLVYTLDIERYSCYHISEAEDEPTSPTSDQPLDYDKELIGMQNTIETKVCTKCGEAKPLSEYGKRKDSKDGHRNDCKACVSARHKSWSKSKSRVSMHNCRASGCAQSIRVCPNCGDNKPLVDYGKTKLRKNGHNSYCKACVTARKQEWTKSNSERSRAYFKARHEEKWANDPEYRDRMYASTARRQRLMAAAKQEFYLRKDIFERDNWTCGLCQEPIDPELKWPERGSASIDHVIPISHGGDDTPANVQAAHLSCNTAKGNRVELEDLEVAA